VKKYDGNNKGRSGQLSMTERQRSITNQVRSEEHERHAMNDDDNEQTEHHRLMSTTGQGKMDEQKIHHQLKKNCTRTMFPPYELDTHHHRSAPPTDQSSVKIIETLFGSIRWMIQTIHGW